MMRRIGRRSAPEWHGLDVDGDAYVRASGTLRVGRDVQLTSRLAMTHVVVYDGATLTIGDHVRIGHGVAIACSAEMSLGPRTSLAPFCMVADTDFHVAGAAGLAPESHPVHVGADVTVGPHTLLMPGTTIGDGARIDAGSIVSGRVPAGAHFGGNPAGPIGRAARTADGPRPTADIIADVFGLESTPDGSVRADQVEGWDSLGSLRLLMAIEDEYGVTVDESALEHAVDVAAWSRVVDRAHATTTTS